MTNDSQDFIFTCKNVWGDQKKNRVNHNHHGSVNSTSSNTATFGSSQGSLLEVTGLKYLNHGCQLNHDSHGLLDLLFFFIARYFLLCQHFINST
jgi:hypothetical protein